MLTNARIGGNERGAVLVLVAVMLPVFALFLAFVVDTGNWWVHKRHLQGVADAAALAGGDSFGGCFSGNPANAYTNMKAVADAYAAFNVWTGSNRGTTSLAYNTNTGAPDDTVPGDPCPSGTNSQMFDVKATEAGLPLFFGGIAKFASVTVRAQARVQLYKATTANGALPIAVADVNPQEVKAFVFGEGSTSGTTTVSLAKAGIANGMNMWSGNVTVPVADKNTQFGVAFGLGKNIGSWPCGLSNTYACFPSGAPGLVLVHGNNTAGGTAAIPVLSSVSAICPSSGSPFFSDASLVSGQTCTIQVQANVGFGVNPTTLKAKMRVNGGAYTAIPASGPWTGTFSASLGAGAVPVSLDWTECTVPPATAAACNSANPPVTRSGSFGNAQRVYGAADEGASGPVKFVALSCVSSCSPAGYAPYSVDSPATPSHNVTMTVTVGFPIDYDTQTLPSNAAPCPPYCPAANPPATLIRYTEPGEGWKGQWTGAAVDNCSNGFAAAMLNGCATSFQINLNRVCPDPSPPPGPPDCMTWGNGQSGAIQSGLNARLSACPANNWPNYLGADPRIVQMLVTDFPALLSQGGGQLPVVNIAEFYVTGWRGSSCAANEAWPFGSKAQRTDDLWGHIIKYVNPSDTGNQQVLCSDPSFPRNAPCFPVLVK